MPNILVSNEKIIGINAVDTGAVILANGAAYPKHVLGDWQIIEVPAVPDGFEPYKYSYINGEIVLTPKEVTPEELAAAKAAKCTEVDKLREAKIALGTPFDFPDGHGTVQTRGLVDARNIQANVSAAHILVAQGETNPVMMFRDQEDVVHHMTPQQMIAMGLAVMARGQAIYAAAWVHKDTINALTKIEEIESYDINQGWPE